MSKKDFVSRKTLARAVAKIDSVPLADADRQVDSVLRAISEALQAGEQVRLSGFGTFEVVARAARTGRNPRTGEVIDVPESQVPRFKPAQQLKAKVAETGGGAMAKLNWDLSAEAYDSYSPSHGAGSGSRRSRAKPRGPHGPGGGPDE